MKLRSTKLRLSVFNILAGASLVALAPAAMAQTASGAGATPETSAALEEIIVTARRKDESVQDVPTTINAVTGAEIANLGITKFEDIATVIPGLTMANNANGIGAQATVRGVAYEVNASGNNGTVEFYLNDAPISAGNLFQSVYDIQQVELLRGPQGTLRGRASPSGSMTVTTRRADLAELGGFISATGNDIGGYNAQGAFGIPLITDKLAVRVAGVFDQNEGNRVKSFNHPADPESETKSGRATVQFEPTDSLQFTLTYQTTEQNIISFDQVESQQVLFPNNPVLPGAIPGYVPPFIRAEDRMAVSDRPRDITQKFDNYNLQGQWAFLGQKLNYVGARNEQHFLSFEPQDLGDFYNPLSVTIFPLFQGYGQSTDSTANATAHELRLSSEERIGGFFDYIVGAFYQKSDTPTDLIRQTAVPAGIPGAPLLINTVIGRQGGNTEKSVYTNLTAQLGAATELSGGVRYIKYTSWGELIQNGTLNPQGHEDKEYDATIYNLSLKHNFTDDLMGYVTYGTSWRPGVSAIGDFNPVKTPLELQFLNLEPEESSSFEVGLKSDALDGRLRTAVSAFYQDFENFVYRSASGVSYVNTSQGPARVSQFNFVAAVPATVVGAEVDVAYAITSSWDVGVVASYANGEIDGGYVPCDDYTPRDGVPDTGAPPTNPATITGTGNVISGCTVDYPASRAPDWSATLQTEYRFPIGSSLNSFVRGLYTQYGATYNDPSNLVDNISSYGLLNLYFGITGGDGAWEVSVYGKNVTETEEVLQRSSSVTNGTGAPTNYYAGSPSTGMVMTAPREFGLNLRYSFGSK